MKAFMVCVLAWAVATCAAAALGDEPEGAIAERSEALKTAFLKHYVPVTFTVSPDAPQVVLPLDLETVANHELLADRLGSEAARAALARNGFVVVDGPGTDLFGAAFKRLKYDRVPIVVTTDSVLHLYHVLFDSALMQIELDSLCGDLGALCEGMLAKTTARLGLKGRAARLVEADEATQAYFAVALRLLDPEWQAPASGPLRLDELVQAELALIEAHSGFAPSPLFGYKEDYSQYVPRGHYTRDVRLERYFRAMMWLGRMAFLLKGNNETISNALVDEAMANRQTVQALLISRDLVGDEALLERWRRLYTVTSFLVGLSDDLTVLDYAAAYPAVRAEAETADVTAPVFLNGVRWFMARRPSPLIYGGTGAQEVTQLDETEATLGRVLEATKGLRVMGQRFVPDSYLMGRLVDLPYTGQGEPFTLVRSPLGLERGFPRGLDVMHLLGSARAMALLEREGDTAYAGYADRVATLEAIFAGFGPDDWHQNLYWSWLAALRTLLGPVGDGAAGYPSFMRTEAYTDKALNTALAAWSQLRHDTILYVKQSYGMVGAGPPPPPTPEPEGYVEPLPALYAELAALNAMSRRGLEALGVLPDEVRLRFERADAIFRRLLALSLKELGGEALNEADRRYIKQFGDTFEDVLGELQTDSRRTTIVADVHTEPNSRLVLEEATGPVDLMWVVWKTPEATVIGGAGPVLSHFEFKQPMGDRLTDEKWREMVKRQTPQRAPWTSSFRAAE
jgi:hypothetical protein